MKVRACSLKIKTKLTNFQIHSPRKKKKSAQINKISNEREVTTNTTELQRTIRDCCEQLHTNKLEPTRNI